MQSLKAASGMEVRATREDEKEYFVGVVRAIDAGIQIHADFAPFVSQRPPLATSETKGRSRLRDQKSSVCCSHPVSLTCSFH